MSLERTRAYFAQYGMEGRIMETEHSSATVELAAQALGCEPSRIAKSLSFMLADGPILIVAAGDAKVDNAKFKAFFHEKARMLTPEQAQSLIGHAVGGVCPFGVNEGVRTYLDVSLKRFDAVYPACGSSNSMIRLTIPELTQYARSLGFIDVCKNWQAQA